ncbi:MAG: heavy metal translocating P-type ATPase [Planctomycetota bacterium]
MTGVTDDRTSSSAWSSATSICVHCGLKTKLPPDSDGRVFCCHGCRGAYQLIHDWGLEAFYDLRDGTPASRPVGDDDIPSADHFTDLDDPKLLGRSAPRMIRRDDAAMQLNCRLSITGLHCAACVWLLEQTPRRVAGWSHSQIDYRGRTIDITFDPQVIPLSKIAWRLDRLGYQIRPLDETTQQTADDVANRSLLIDVAVAGFCAANAMWVAIALYAGQFTGIASSHAIALRVAGVVLGLIAVLVPGRVFFRTALASIWTRTPHMDLPVAVGLSAGALMSLVSVLDLSREIYFDSIATLVFFLLVGRWIQMRQQRRAGDEVAELIRLAPRIANVVDDEGAVHRVPVDELQIDDVVRVSGGESIPIDGVVISGNSFVDRSLLTGESQPIRVTIGDMVEAGTDNTQSELHIRASAVGDQTRLAGLTDAVGAAVAARTPTVQLANLIGGWFVVVVLVLALMTLAIWWQNDPSVAVEHAVALLIVACPCALALATPLAIAVGIGRLASQGVLVRSGEALERFTQPGIVFFDKTGTLTRGRMGLTHRFGDLSCLPTVAWLEKHVQHPIATAIVDAIDINSETNTYTGDDLRQEPGFGIEAIVKGDNWRIGNAAWARAGNTQSFDSHAATIISDGSSPIWIAINSQTIAMLGVSDPIREDASSVISSLRRLGWRVGILSGDHPQTVNRVAEQLSIDPTDARGGCRPEDKLTTVKAAAEGEYSRRGAVLMVGDGLNDASALAAADVGIAIRGGAATSLAAAPILIANNDLGNVVTLIRSAGRIRAAMRRNFAASITYNALAVGLSMLGWISPLIAAALMPISSITVIAMTLGSRMISNHD